LSQAWSKPSPAEPAERTVPAERMFGFNVDRLSEAERRKPFEN
jgi:hypothetical protein